MKNYFSTLLSFNLHFLLWFHEVFVFSLRCDTLHNVISFARASVITSIHPCLAFSIRLIFVPASLIQWRNRWRRIYKDTKKPHRVLVFYLVFVWCQGLNRDPLTNAADDPFTTLPRYGLCVTEGGKTGDHCTSTGQMYISWLCIKWEWFYRNVYTGIRFLRVGALRQTIRRARASIITAVQPGLADSVVLSFISTTPRRHGCLSWRHGCLLCCCGRLCWYSNFK